MKSTLFAHKIWTELLKPGDTAIDATCGNGYDTVVLAELVGCRGTVSGYDIQREAITKTQARLQRAGIKGVTLRQASHDVFAETSAKLIVYNLGYLPGGDKTVTTRVDTTLSSVRHALDILETGGMVSILCYPGHKEGAQEEAALLTWAEALSPEMWSCHHHRWINREHAPSLLLISSMMVTVPQTTSTSSGVQSARADSKASLGD